MREIKMMQPHKENDKIYTSKSLSEEMNKERARRGEGEIPEINPCKGSTNTLARKRQVMEQRVGFFRKGFQEEINRCCLLGRLLLRRLSRNVSSAFLKKILAKPSKLC